MNNSSQTTQQQVNNKELTQTDAIKVLIRAVQVAQEKGCYTLDEAALVHQAVSKFVIPSSNDNSEEKKTSINNTEVVSDQ